MACLDRYGCYLTYCFSLHAAFLCCIFDFPLQARFHYTIYVTFYVLAITCFRALVRPGRLEEHIHLTLPTVNQREEFVKSLLLKASERVKTDQVGLLVERIHKCAKVCAEQNAGRYILSH